jgi:hypothetical protein
MPLQYRVPWTIYDKCHTNKDALLYVPFDGSYIHVDFWMIRYTNYRHTGVLHYVHIYVSCDYTEI